MSGIGSRSRQGIDLPDCWFSLSVGAFVLLAEPRPWRYVVVGGVRLRSPQVASASATRETALLYIALSAYPSSFRSWESIKRLAGSHLDKIFISIQNSIGIGKAQQDRGQTHYAAYK
jgi:hypothetical protein